MPSIQHNWREYKYWPFVASVAAWLGACFSALPVIRRVRVGEVERLLALFWLIALACVFFTDTLSDIIVNAGLFIASVVAGCILQRHVTKEREKKEQMTEMLSFATHQLKSPLAAISGYASMVYEGDAGPISPIQRRIVGNLYDATEHLSRIVEDFLGESKLAQGALAYTMHPFDLSILVKEIVHAMNLRHHDIKVSLSVDGRVPYMIVGDREKIRHVVINIVDNAFKYTEKGSIRARLSKTCLSEVCFAVTDTGIGIAPSDLETIFLKFRRGASGKIVSGGSGLGLYLARVILSAHGGRIWAESRGPGKGSVFTLVLPCSNMRPGK